MLLISILTFGAISCYGQNVRIHNRPLNSRVRLMHNINDTFGTVSSRMLSWLCTVPTYSFRPFRERHERKSVIIPTNLPFSEWGQVLQTERLAVAMLDRITHNATILEMNGESLSADVSKEEKGGKECQMTD